jgi:hypothetical protein
VPGHGTDGREVWEKRIQRLRDSELTDAEFAAELGVNVHTLRSWKWKFKEASPTTQRRAASPRTGTRAKRLAQAARGVTFAEMAIAPGVVAGGIELRVREVDVRVRSGSTSRRSRA